MDIQMPVWVTTTALPILIILTISLIIMKLTGAVSARILNLVQEGQDSGEFKKRAGTLGNVIQYILNIVIMIIAGLMILDKLGIAIAPILGAAGIVGIAVGFGAQKIVEDVISGFFILLDNKIRMGDVVQIGDKAGLVERVNLRMVVLRDLAGNVHFIRNGEVGIVTNMTKDFSYCVFDIGIAYKEDVDKVMDVIKSVDEDLRSDDNFQAHILAPIEVLGLDRFDDSAVVIKARIKTKPIEQWGIMREFNRRLKNKFDELNIEIPFPQRTVHHISESQ